jgi:hypothetical protein
MNDAERTLGFGTGKMPVLQEMGKKNFFRFASLARGKRKEGKGQKGKRAKG